MGLRASFSKTSFIAVLIGATTMAATLPPRGWAMLAPSRMAKNTSPGDTSSREQDMKVIQKTLESKMLRQRLQEFGYSQEETNRRLSKLSDRQVHQLAMDTQHLNPGGDILIPLLVLGILVLLFIYLLERVV